MTIAALSIADITYTLKEEQKSCYVIPEEKTLSLAATLGECFRKCGKGNAGHIMYGREGTVACVENQCECTCIFGICDSEHQDEFVDLYKRE